MKNLINYLKILVICRIGEKHVPPIRGAKKLVCIGDRAICTRCRQKIKLMSNGEWLIL